MAGERHLLTPVEIKFRGLDADANRLDAIQLGKSIQGTARIYNSLLYFWYHGEVPLRLHQQDVRVQVGPPRSGTLTYLIYTVMTHGSLALYPDLLWELADLSIPAFLKAIFAKKSGRDDLVLRALETVDKQSDTIKALAVANVSMLEKHDAFARTVHSDQMRTIDQLVAVVGKLAESNSAAMRTMVEPIGRSALSLTHFAGVPDKEIVIDEPLAEALRSLDPVVVSDQTNYRAKIMGVDKTTGACRVELEGSTKDVRGKITDPALQFPGNVYTHALDTAVDVNITAKPVLKDGEIKTLYISDAKDASKRDS